MQPRSKGGPYALGQGTLPPPPILQGTSLCFKRGRAAKTFRMPLKVLEYSEGPSSTPHLFCALGLPEVAQMSPQGWGHKGQPVEPSVCIFSLGLVLLQGRSQDPNFQREEARPGKEGGG